MKPSNRRKFLKQAEFGAAGASLAWAGAPSRALGANERVVVGVVGCGRGRHVGRAFAGLPDAEVAYTCDLHKDRREKTKKDLGASKAVFDFREILDDTAVDVLVVATPDHWHAPAAIMALGAGKHVYVEKTCSHNIREGQLLIEAARRNKRVVQHGTQARSNSMMIDAIALLREGVIGDVLVCKAWNIQRRGNIGHGKPSDPPNKEIYDAWVGPAFYVPYQSNRFDGNWHWWYNFGTGGMGNDGVHDVDYALWGLGVETHPSTVAALGGKYFFDDDQEFPDTQNVIFDYPGDGKPGNRRQLIYEQRLWSTNYPHNTDSGVEFYGTKGQLFLSRRGKIQILGERNRRLEHEVSPLGQQDEPHAKDMVDAIRAGRRPRADIETGHRTATLVHLGNLAARLGRSLQFNPQKEEIIGDDEAAGLTRRRYREGHWAVPKGV